MNTVLVSLMVFIVFVRGISGELLMNVMVSTIEVSTSIVLRLGCSMMSIVISLSMSMVGYSVICILCMRLVWWVNRLV